MPKLGETENGGEGCQKGKSFGGSGLGQIVATLHLLYSLTFAPSSFDRLHHPIFNVMAGKNTQLERAIKEIQGRRPAPDIDFTQHQLENGFTVSTQERVVKEVLPSFPLTHAYTLTDRKPIGLCAWRESLCRFKPRP